MSIWSKPQTRWSTMPLWIMKPASTLSRSTMAANSHRNDTVCRSVPLTLSSYLTQLSHAATDRIRWPYGATHTPSPYPWLDTANPAA